MLSKGEKITFTLFGLALLGFALLSSYEPPKKETKETKVVFVDTIPEEPKIDVVKELKSDKNIMFRARVTNLISEMAKEFKIPDTRNYIDAIVDASMTYNVKPEIIVTVIAVESSFRKNVVSSAGAIGPMQVIPEIWEKEIGILKPDVFYDNIQMGTYILKKYKDKCGNWECAFKAYNVGITNYRNKRQPEAQERYFAKIQKILNRL